MAGACMRAPMVRASTSAVMFATCWSPNATCSSTRWRRRAGQRIVGHVLRRSRRPRPGPRASGSARRRAAGPACRGRTRRAAAGTAAKSTLRLSSVAVVHARHAEHGRWQSCATAIERAAHDAAQAVAVVDSSARGSISDCPASGRPGGREAVGVTIAPAEEDEVEHPLLQPVGHRTRKVREVAEHLATFETSASAMPEPLRGAEHEVVLAAPSPRTLRASTSVASLNRPWPYREGCAGRATGRHAGSAH